MYRIHLVGELLLYSPRVSNAPVDAAGISCYIPPKKATTPSTYVRIVINHTRCGPALKQAIDGKDLSLVIRGAKMSQKCKSLFYPVAAGKFQYPSRIFLR